MVSWQWMVDFRRDLLAQLDEIETPQPFAYQHQTRDAPNPALIIHGLDTIGLPLSPYDAQRIINHAQTGPFNETAHPRVGGGARSNISELSSSQFEIQNPEFLKFIMRMGDSACKELGVPSGVAVEAKLCKLLLYEKGPCEAQIHAKSGSDAVGVLFISLPSFHEGGDVAFTHDQDFFLYDSDFEPVISTSVVAWHPDASQQWSPIKTGYRLALSFELKQQDCQPVQPRQDGIMTSLSLKYLLQIYEQKCHDDEVYPRFLVHHLQHAPNWQTSIDIADLRGRDRSQVDTLKTICDELNFDLYLGSMNQVQWMSKYNWLNINFRSYKFTRIFKLNGEAHSALPLVYEDHVLDVNFHDPESGSSDESDSEDGVDECNPSYTDTVLIMVPPSCKLLFSFNPDDWEDNLKLLREAQMRVSKDDILRLCKSIVDIAYISCDGERSEREECVIEALVISLQHHDRDVFDHIRDNDSYASLCLEALSRVKPRSSRTKAAPSSATNERSSSIAQLAAAMKDIVARKSSPIRFLPAARTSHDKIPCPWERKTVPVSETWYSDAAKSVIPRIVKPLTGWDGRSLGRIAASVDKETRTLISAAISSCPTPTAWHFVVSLLHTNREGSMDHIVWPLVEEAVAGIWKNFAFHPQTIKELDAALRDESLLEHSIFQEDDIDALLKITLSVEGDPAAECLEIMRRAVHKTSAAYLHTTLVPFLKGLWKNQVDCNKTVLCLTAVFDLTKEILFQYIRKYVRAEPPNRSTIRRGCGCNDCCRVNQFLSNPELEVLDFPCNKKRRKHLDTVFIPFYTSKNYTVEIIPLGSPYVWLMTKTGESHKRWLERYESASAEVRALAQENVDRLRSCLGDEMEAYLSCQVERLSPPTKRRTALEDISTNINSQTPTTGTKRKADDKDDGDQAPLAKSIRS